MIAVELGLALKDDVPVDGLVPVPVLVLVLLEAGIAMIWESAGGGKTHCDTEKFPRS